MPNRRSKRLNKNKTLNVDNDNSITTNSDENSGNNNNDNSTKKKSRKRKRTKVKSKYLDTKPDCIAGKIDTPSSWDKKGVKKLSNDKYHKWLGCVLESNTLYWLIWWKKGKKRGKLSNMVSPFKVNQLGGPALSRLKAEVNNWGADQNAYDLFDTITYVVVHYI